MYSEEIYLKSDWGSFSFHSSTTTVMFLIIIETAIWQYILGFFCLGDSIWSWRKWRTGGDKETVQRLYKERVSLLCMRMCVCYTYTCLSNFLLCLSLAPVKLISCAKLEACRSKQILKSILFKSKRQLQRRWNDLQTNFLKKYLHTWYFYLHFFLQVKCRERSLTFSFNISEKFDKSL